MTKDRKRNSLLKHAFPLGVLFFFFNCAPNVKAQIKIELLEDKQLTTHGLYFEGENNINYRFGKRITPHGDCIDVINGYVFVTWYKGGMDKRNLMVSRKKIEGGEWKTIEFPDQHIGYRGDTTIGDSHNTAAIKVCPIDSTVHLIYDMHAYSKASFPENYFNYRVSVKKGAFVSDEQWTIDNFSVKRHYLNPNINYEKSTYPGFLRFDDGRIMVELRFGGSGNGNNQLAIYDGTNWSNNIQYNNGNQSEYSEKYSIYGSYQFLHGKLIAGYSIRYRIANDDAHPLYQLNNGFFYSESKSPYQQNNWTDIAGNPISLPVENPNLLKVAEPCNIGLGNRISMGPIWTVTKNGAIHFLTAVSGNDVHFYKAPDSNSFEYSEDCPKANGNFFCWEDKILNVALENNKVVVRTTPEGENNWEVVYQQNGGESYRHFNAYLHKNKLFLYLMQTGSGDAQPITLLTYSITKKETANIKQQTSNKIEIYPNPVNNVMFVKGICDNLKVEIFNLQGQKYNELKSQETKDALVINTDKLHENIYIIKVNDQTSKFIKSSNPKF